MLKAVSNQTDLLITLGGVEIKSKSQTQIRESLIKKEELDVIKSIGCVVSFTSIIAVKNDKVPEKPTTETKVNPTYPEFVSHVAYPEKMIKQNGEVTGKFTLQDDIKALQEKHPNLKSDKEFTQIYGYESKDIDPHRVGEDNGK